MFNPDSDIWDDLYKDPPFNVHIVHRLEDASHIVGDAAKIYLEQFEEMYKASLANCIITTIAGDPGTGKSYFLAHLKYRMLKEDMPGIPIIMRLKGREYDTKYIYRTIREDEGYKQACRDVGLTVKDVAEEVIGQTIREEIGDIRCKKPDVSICLLVDNVDEYVRSNAFRYEEVNKESSDEAKQRAMLSLLTLFNGVIDTIGTGVLIVLSLTVDMVNILMSIVGKDSTLLRRFSPIYKSRDSNKIHLFGDITLEDAFEMVAYNMEGWFERKKKFDRKVLPDCIYNGFNTYPFSAESIKLLYEASQYPGEIILGCLSSIQRYHELEKDANNDDQSQSTHSSFITETYAALGILQMSDYFRNVNLDEDVKDIFTKRLVAIINRDSNVLYRHTLPQIVERTKLEEVMVFKNLGIPFLDFLGKLLKGEDFRKVQSHEVFLRTRGKITYPKLPTVDCLFDYEGKRIGVQFLLEDSPNLNKSKLYTSCSAIQSRGADQIPENDTLDGIIFICLIKDKNRHSILKKVRDFINQPQNGNRFINVQGKDYRPCVGLVEVDQEDAWKWRALSKTNLIDETQKMKLAIMMERVDYFVWIVSDGVVNEMKFESKTWNDLIKRLGLPFFKTNHKGQPKSGGGGWER